MPSTRTSPISRWCAVGHRPHSLVPGSWSMRSSGRATTLAGTPAARSDSATANRSRVARPLADAGVERVLHRGALGEGVVARIGGPRLVDHLGHPLPVVVVTARDGDPVVVALGGVDAVRHAQRRVAAVRVGLAVAPQRAAVDRVVEEVGTDQRGAGLGARHVDPLALAGAVAVDQPGEDGDGHDVGAHVVHVGEAPARPAAGRASPELNVSPDDRLHDRAPRLERRVRPPRAEAAVRHVDDVGLDRAAARRRRSPCAPSRRPRSSR